MSLPCSLEYRLFNTLISNLEIYQATPNTLNSFYPKSFLADQSDFRRAMKT